MKNLLRFVILVSLFTSIRTILAKEQEEIVFLFQNRRVGIVVPAGFGIANNKDERGTMVVKLANRKETVSAEITFLPDPEDRYAAPRDRKEFINETFRAFVETSVEKAMQFEELNPRAGSGTFCMFTDASLVGKTKLPPGEFLCSTTGVKAWPGVLAIFSIFSNDTKSKEYQSLMAMLRESVEEKPVSPLK